MNMNTKTFKREVALALLIALLAFGVAGLWFTAAVDVLKIFIVPFMSFIGLSFGLDSWSKQIQKK